MGKEWADFFTYFSMWSVLIPITIGLCFFKRFNAIQQLIGLVVLTTVCGELVTYVTHKLDFRNIPMIHLFTVIQFVLLVLVLAKGLRPLFSDFFFKGIIIAFVLFAFVDAIWLNGIYNFNSYSRPLAAFLLLFLTLCFFYKTLKELKIKSLEREPLFWIGTGILIYFSGSLIIFLFTNYVKTSNEALLTLWGIHAIFNIIFNVFYAIALWIKPAN